MSCPSTRRAAALRPLRRQSISRAGSQRHISSTRPAGDSVDQAPLCKGRIAGAGLDDFAEEPMVTEALRVLEKVTLPPHIGSANREVREAIGHLAADNLDAFFAGTTLPSRVV